MKKIFSLLLIGVCALAARAEKVKGGTEGAITSGGTPVVRFDDSARLYPYEPLMGDTRLVMWVGFTDTGNVLHDGTLKTGSTLITVKDYTPCGKTIAAVVPTYVNDLFAGNYPHLKKIAFYLYIPDKAIIESSRMEPRFEQVMAQKKKNRYQAFEVFKKDFEFIDAILTDTYNMHFVHDERSPDGINDFRMMVFTDAEKQIIAVATDGYRKLEVNAKEKHPLDRTFTIYYLEDLPEEERRKMEDAYMTAYRYRD